MKFIGLSKLCVVLGVILSMLLIEGCNVRKKENSEAKYIKYQSGNMFYYIVTESAWNSAGSFWRNAKIGFGAFGFRRILVYKCEKASVMSKDICMKQNQNPQEVTMDQFESKFKAAEETIFSEAMEKIKAAKFVYDRNSQEIDQYVSEAELTLERAKLVLKKTIDGNELAIQRIENDSIPAKQKLIEMKKADVSFVQEVIKEPTLLKDTKINLMFNLLKRKLNVNTNEDAINELNADIVSHESDIQSDLLGVKQAKFDIKAAKDVYNNVDAENYNVAVEKASESRIKLQNELISQVESYRKMATDKQDAVFSVRTSMMELYNMANSSEEIEMQQDAFYQYGPYYETLLATLEIKNK